MSWSGERAWEEEGAGCSWAVLDGCPCFCQWKWHSGRVCLEVKLKASPTARPSAAYLCSRWYCPFPMRLRAKRKVAGRGLVDHCFSCHPRGTHTQITWGTLWGSPHPLAPRSPPLRSQSHHLLFLEVTMGSSLPLPPQRVQSKTRALRGEIAGWYLFFLLEPLGTFVPQLGGSRDLVAMDYISKTPLLCPTNRWRADGARGHGVSSCVPPEHHCCCDTSSDHSCLTYGMCLLSRQGGKVTVPLCL